MLEIRKTRPRGNDPYTVLVYVTGDVGVVGEFVCDCFYKLDTMPEITPWALPQQDSGKPLWGWHITQLKEYARAISLPEVGVKKAPQSWCYLGG